MLQPSEMRPSGKQPLSKSAAPVDLLRAKWTIHILRVLRSESTRIGKLHRVIPQATKKMLVETLRRMEAVGLIKRTDLSRAVLHVEYSLEPHAKLSTLALLDCLDEWSTSLAQKDPIHEQTSSIRQTPSSGFDRSAVAKEGKGVRSPELSHSKNGSDNKSLKSL